MPNHLYARPASHLLSGVARVADLLSDNAADLSRTARFLRGYLQFQVRPQDIFLSSYPRSGTTWLQYILHVLVHDGDSGFRHIAQVAPWFERNLSLGRCQADDFEGLRSPRIFKSHLPLHWLPKGARYIYIERDGRDVALSYYHFYRSHLGYQGDLDEFFDQFLCGNLQYGSWFKHTAGFRRLLGRPDLLLLQYEALLDDLPGQMHRIANFCGLKHSPARITALSELCRFTRMKRDQERFDHAAGEGVRPVLPGQFIRKGSRGDHRSALSTTQMAAFKARRTTPFRHPEQEWNLAAFLH